MDEYPATPAFSLLREDLMPKVASVLHCMELESGCLIENVSIERSCMDPDVLSWKVNIHGVEEECQ